MSTSASATVAVALGVAVAATVAVALGVAVAVSESTMACGELPQAASTVRAAAHSRATTGVPLRRGFF